MGKSLMLRINEIQKWRNMMKMKMRIQKMKFQNEEIVRTRENENKKLKDRFENDKLDNFQRKKLRIKM